MIKWAIESRDGPNDEWEAFSGYRDREYDGLYEIQDERDMELKENPGSKKEFRGVEIEFKEVSKTVITDETRKW